MVIQALSGLAPWEAAALLQEADRATVVAVTVVVVWAVALLALVVLDFLKGRALTFSSAFGDGGVGPFPLRLQPGTGHKPTGEHRPD